MVEVTVSAPYYPTSQASPGAQLFPSGRYGVPARDVSRVYGGGAAEFRATQASGQTPTQRSKQLYRHLVKKGYSKESAEKYASAAFYEMGGKPGKSPYAAPTVATQPTIEAEGLPTKEELEVRQTVREGLARRLPSEIGKDLGREISLYEQQLKTYNAAVADFNKKYGGRELSQSELKTAQSEMERLERGRVAVEETGSFLQGQVQAVEGVEQQRSLQRASFASGRMTTEEAIKRKIVTVPDSFSARVGLGAQIVGEKAMLVTTGATGRETQAFVGGEFRPTGRVAGQPTGTSSDLLLRVASGVSGLPLTPERKYLAGSVAKGMVTTPLGLVALASDPLKVPEKVVGSLETISRRVETPMGAAGVGAEIAGGALVITVGTDILRPVISKAIKSAGIEARYRGYQLRESLGLTKTKLPRTETIDLFAKLESGKPAIKSIPRGVQIKPDVPVRAVVSPPGKASPIMSIKQLNRLLGEERGTVSIPTAIQVQIPKTIPRVVLPSTRVVTGPVLAVGRQTFQTPVAAVGLSSIALTSPASLTTSRQQYASITAALTRMRELSIAKTPASVRGLVPAQLMDTASIQGLKQAQRQELIPITIPQVIETPKVIPKTITKPVPPEVTITATGTPPTSSILKKSKKFVPKSGKYKEAFDVYVKQFGKWKKLATKLPKKRAFRAGKQFTTTTPARTFRLQPAGKTKMKDIETMPSLKQFYAKKGSFTEKVKYAIDTAGEYRGITLKGRKAKRKRRKSK